MIDDFDIGQFFRRTGLAMFGLAGVVLSTGRVLQIQEERADTPAAQLHAAFLSIESVSSARSGNRVTAILDDDAVRFPFDSYEILPQYSSVLDRIGAAIARQATARVTVHGHTDDVGSAEYNDLLSYRRAEAVSRRLVINGMNPEKVTVVAHGYRHPTADNATRFGRAKNRRVEVEVYTGGRNPAPHAPNRNTSTRPPLAGHLAFHQAYDQVRCVQPCCGDHSVACVDHHRDRLLDSSVPNPGPASARYLVPSRHSEPGQRAEAVRQHLQQPRGEMR